MNKPGLDPAVREAGQGRVLEPNRVGGMVFSCAIEVFIKTFLVLLFGGIALRIAGSIWREMIPSHAPGFKAPMELEAASPGWWGNLGGTLNQHRFVVVYVMLLALTLWRRVASTRRRNSKAGSRLERVAGRVATNWFGLIVGNAFGAMIAAMVLTWVQQFMPMRMLLSALLDAVMGSLQTIAHALLGTSSSEGIKNWWEWYAGNSFKFAFWVFYLAAICDDLGMPNFKSLGRWIGRRLRKRRQGQHSGEDPRVRAS